MLASVESVIVDQLKHYPTVKRWVVAYSGGLDSTVLLHALCRALQSTQASASVPVSAIHINHQLSAHANEWEQHCQRQAKKLGIDYVVERVAIIPEGRGLEAAARDARYTVFTQLIQPEDALLMAHHENDQAETFLLRLLRGAGVLGLSAMTSERTLGKGLLLRPLLKLSRNDLEAYAKEHQLTWVEDESNELEVFDRNYIRQKIIPVLNTRWPQSIKRLSQTSYRMQQTQELLDELAEMDLKQLGERHERVGVSIDWRQLRTLSEARVNNLFRFWCQSQQLPAPDAQQLHQIHTQFLSQNAMLTGAVVAWSQCELRQFNHRLYLMATLRDFSAPNETMSWAVFNHHEIILGEAGTLSAHPLPLADSVINHQSSERNPQGLSAHKINNQPLTVAWRKGGERCTPAGRSGSQTVKKLLQEYKLETWLRDRVPLIYVGDTLAAVGDLWVCEEFLVDAQAEQAQDAYYFKWASL